MVSEIIEKWIICSTAFQTNSKENAKVQHLSEGWIPPMTGGFLSRMVSNVERVSMT